MARREHRSWGRRSSPGQVVRSIDWTTDPLDPGKVVGTLLPYGLGRSYGDSCLNEGGTLLDASGLDRFISFDRESGLLRCEAGVTLGDILGLAIPSGWFLPVTPGTRFVTVGGAIANDVHGKNHHRAGTFGRHVERFELVRSCGERIVCSPAENAEWFGATIGGLGLTGLIAWADVRLKRIASPDLDVETIRFGELDEFFSLSAESDRAFEYTVAWVDCFAKGASLGRGLFMRANHVETAHGRMPGRMAPPNGSGTFDVPFDFPELFPNRILVKAFNGLYYHKQRGKIVRSVVSHGPFFHPLDALGHWNRLYGKRGFFQYQCVVPEGEHREATRSIMETVASSSTGSYLAVLKIFGDVRSPGMLSFPRRGVTLALDFPDRGDETMRLMDRLDATVREAGGSVYPAKDARMSAESFDAFFPQWRDFSRYVDPRFSSCFWRRVTGDRRGIT